jgi:hypothetical protein
MSRFEFTLATPADEPGLLELARFASPQGTMRIGFDRTPDYFASLRPEGRQTEVMVCREVSSGRVIAVGHRSIRPLWVNGTIAPVGYLGGLRLSPEVKGGLVLARGYRFLRERHADRRTEFYLSTIMEENRQALAILQSGRCGLPRYDDLGRFRCMAVGMRLGNRLAPSQLQVRPAAPTDLAAMIAFFHREGPKRQFFPVYEPQDFGRTDGLLPGLVWDNIMLAWQGTELVGVAAAWDQREFRRWHVAGYAPWLRVLRLPLNLVAACRGLPRLPPPGDRPAYFMLSLVCVRDFDPQIGESLLDEIIARHRNRYAFFLAGLHERDPLMPVLQARPHVPMPSRLFAVAWDDGGETVRRLRPELVPYLELGAL